MSGPNPVLALDYDALVELRGRLRSLIAKEVTNPFVRDRIYRRMGKSRLTKELDRAARAGTIAARAGAVTTVYDHVDRLLKAVRPEVSDTAVLRRIRDGYEAALLEVGVPITPGSLQPADNQEEVNPSQP